ncbi:Terpene synthase [Melia azedarach]|uniref:Terpene synthase n=1 Tax=Melia azedarach TaxID=155640 RepID=A0ACC1WWC2_MELAZ|nr:Terpene synthase [Melia azedarach]
MDFGKQLQAQQRQLLCCQTNSEAFNVITPPRQPHSYKPNIWRYDVIQSLQSKYKEEGYRRQAEKLVDDVKLLFLAAADEVLPKLQLVDRIGKLGLSYLFQEEIRGALDTISSIKNGSPCLEGDLYATALCFKLLRQYGYEVSQDVFIGFMDEKGTFSSANKCTDDIKGLIELFEASHLVLEGENILEEAKVFSKATLKDIYPTLNSELGEKVAKVLELPSHWRVQWFEVRWHINSYENEKHNNQILLELAKLNFNIVQATLQNDLREVSRWWRNLGLIENLNFSRDRLVESYMCAVGLAYEPKHSCFRKWLTKVVIFILVIDDIYDIYGSLEELQQFTNAVERWDSREIENLPECMKICFQALYETANEMANEIQKEKGWNIKVLPHLRKVWADFCKALFLEAKWHHNGYTPSLEEYLSNAWISSSGALLSAHSFFSIMSEVTEETADFLGPNQDLVYNSSLIIRLCNDLGTSAAELERGDVASSILCCMMEMNISEEKARNHIKGVISNTWTKLNGQCFNQSPLFQSFVNITTKFARVAHSLYQYGDGFGVQDRDTKKHILSLLIEPL